MHFARYLDELRFSLRVGHRADDKLKLCVNTLRYHAGNGLRTSADAHCPPTHYALDLTPILPATGPGSSSREGPEPLDLWLRTTGGDLFVFYEILMDEAYAVDSLSLNDVQTVVDLGANIGLTTVYLSHHFPEATFVCVEPNPWNLQVLERNLSVLQDRVRIIERAVGRATQSSILDDTGTSYASRLSAHSTSGTRVDLISMSDLIDRCRLDTIDVLKVDIEGAEQALFADNPSWLSRVRAILVELHGSYTMAAFREDVEGYGFEVYPSPTDRGLTLAVRTG